jgi:hypothetical protein
MKPEVPMTPPDRGRGQALAGLWCGLGAFIAAVLAAFAGVSATSGVFGMTSGEGVLLAIAALPLALVGVVLSIWGWKSTSRRSLAIAGLVFSLLFIVIFCLGAAVIDVSWSLCSRQPTGCI